MQSTGPETLFLNVILNNVNIYCNNEVLATSNETPSCGNIAKGLKFERCPIIWEPEWLIKSIPVATLGTNVHRQLDVETWKSHLVAETLNSWMPAIIPQHKKQSQSL